MAENSESEANFLEQLVSSRNRDISFFLPFLFGLSGSQESQNPRNGGGDERNQERLILINPFTQGMIVIEGGGRGFDEFMRQISEKQGLAPATKASIDAMPKVVITEKQEDSECSICLDGFEIGAEAREMPCKHRYHSNCIEKWLGIHGSCPVCRFTMPVDEEDGGGKRNNSGGAGAGGGEILVTLSVTRRNPSSASANSDNSASANSDNSSS
ncbi:hypothetical protein MKW94_026680 [Papaver nudicaule]|uniref:RING-type E3 ubiquitin transferase n=1 Tax=Papaver nudicaule TaxID=74823 RepID=A0AA42AYM6_PAPNU|nr:hypothetical protein [Papaver nudicaule]